MPVQTKEKPSSIWGRYEHILSLFFPELVTLFILYSALNLIDSRLIAELRSTATYAILGVSNNFIFLVQKFGEGFLTVMIVLCGTENGAGRYKRVGEIVQECFWLISLLGFVIAGILFLGAPSIYAAVGIKGEMLELGIPYLRLKAVSIFLMYAYFAFMGFMRSIRNTRILMIFFALGATTFVFFDYALILGKFGFPAMGLQGSALAYIIQYAAMLLGSLIYIFVKHRKSPYAVKYFSGGVSLGMFKETFLSALPVFIDKLSVSLSFIWMAKLLAPMGAVVLASYVLVKDMGLIIMLPSIALSQVMTSLASNYLGNNDWEALRDSMKRSILIAAIFMAVTLAGVFLFTSEIIAIFDKKGEFTSIAAQVIPLISVMFLVDAIQTVLSGTMRGIGEFRLVMLVRVIILGGFYFPTTYAMTHLLIDIPVETSFILYYSTYYTAQALMIAVYSYRFVQLSQKHLATA
ncbi:MAG: MATE family multidrug resistance protein [Chlamydiales bacterium]|jgi:MATE family multidrug resistance protein